MTKKVEVYEEEAEPKPFWQSKTIWLNVIAVVIAILTGLEEMVSTGEAITLISVINIGLRYVTTSGIKL